jgi:hypothetical protein
MSIVILSGESRSSLAIRLAALVCVTGRNDLMSVIEEELRTEIEDLLKWLEALPENLGKVLAWEALTNP